MQIFTCTGNLGRDPELRTTGCGKSVANFSIAVSSGFGDNKRTDWFECVAWERKAEAISQNLSKGSKVAIQGQIRFDEWEDKETGQKRKQAKLIVDQIEFLNSRDHHEEESPATDRESGTKSVSRPATKRPMPQQSQSFMDDDVPF
jgi:single-strand DNA-binding protein